jgi:hypothetical protein
MKGKGSVLAVVALSIALLAGCSNDGGDAVKSVSGMVSGKVSDGPIRGATVFIDSNNNNEHDSSELSTVTDDDGSYVLFLDGRELDMPVTMIATGGQNALTKKIFNEKFRAMLPSLEEADGVYLTPLSDLVALHYGIYHVQGNATATTDSASIPMAAPTLAQSEEIIAKALNLDADKILTDPMGDYQVFQAAQEVQAIKGLLVGADANSDIEKIKQVLVQTLHDSGTLDPKTVIANVEAALKISYSDSINAFMSNELAYVDGLLALLDSTSNLKYMRYILGDIETKAHARLDSGELDTIVKAQKVYLSLSGGGWHAHTTHVAWVMGALDGMASDGKSRTLEALTEHVDAISSNSGGSWFLSMLAFADNFKTQVETYAALEYYSSGWLGQQKDIFINDYNKNNKGVTDTSKMLKDWVASAQNCIFKPFNLYETLNATTLDDEHLSWAKDKALVFATSLGTGRIIDSGSYDESGVVLNYPGYYPNTYLLNTTRPGVYAQVAATPVLLTSLGDSGQEKSAPFLAGDFTLTYSNTQSDPSGITNDYDADVQQSKLSIFDAATCSSAAFGYAANASEPLGDLVSGAGPGSAVPMQITENVIELVQREISDEATLEDVATANYMRFFDGGYVDNTSVAYMMKHLQENGLDNNFKIVLFMNDTGGSSEDTKNQDFSIDSSVAKLFGEFDTNESFQTVQLMHNFGAWLVGLSPDVMSPDIFDGASWDSIHNIYDGHKDAQIGDGAHPKKIYMQYRVYNVTTKENSTLGIKAGSKGELHVFTNYMPAATPMPGQPTGPNFEDSFNMYNAMLETVRTGFGGNNWSDLKSALNLIE